MKTKQPTEYEIKKTVTMLELIEENKALKKENDELTQWRKGMKGVEEFYDERSKKEALLKMLLRLRYAFYVENSSKKVKEAFIAIADEFNSIKISEGI